MSARTVCFATDSALCMPNHKRAPYHILPLPERLGMILGFICVQLACVMLCACVPGKARFGRAVKLHTLDRYAFITHKT